MNYLVAVLSEQTQVEAAQSALENANLPKEKISILGRGYESADEFGLINPDRQASHRVKRLLYWLIPFGFVAGYAFNILTGIQIFSLNDPIANHFVGGIFGAVAGALGALVTGGAIGWTVGSGDALTYRNRLNAGKYLIIVKGTDELLLQATQILRQFDPENIQGYMEAAK
jgi:hypothetical protein